MGDHQRRERDAALRGRQAMKVAIVGGAGGVGASLAFNLLVAGRDDDVVLVDARPRMVASHVLDLEQTLELAPGATLRTGGPEELAGADALVICAAVPLTLDSTRLAYLHGNAAIAAEIAALVPAGWGGTILVVTNPVDPLVCLVRDLTGLDRRRVLGYTLNDSLRLRTGIAKALGAPPGTVEAWVLGEHGDSSVPLFDRVRLRGVPVTLTEGQRERALGFLRTWYARHVALDSGRSSTWTTGLGAARMLRALEAGGSIWPASVVLEGEYGIRGSAVGVPVTLGPGGAEQIHEWELQPDDLQRLQASAAIVAAVTPTALGRPARLPDETCGGAASARAGAPSRA
jgi:malate dehydrogenase